MFSGHERARIFRNCSPKCCFTKVSPFEKTFFFFNFLVFRKVISSYSVLLKSTYSKFSFIRLKIKKPCVTFGTPYFNRCPSHPSPANFIFRSQRIYFVIRKVSYYRINLLPQIKWSIPLTSSFTICSPKCKNTTVWNFIMT